MGCSVKVLTTIGNYEPNNFANPDIREKTIKSFQDDLESSISDSYPSAIDCFKTWDPDPSIDSDEFILGYERPAEICEFVKNWNKNVVDQCAKEFAKLEAEATKAGKKSISSLLGNLIDENGDIKELNYSLYTLRKCLAPLDDVFVYDSYGDLIYIDSWKGANGEYVSCYGTIMTSNVRDYIIQHPEEFVIIELVYE